MKLLTRLSEIAIAIALVHVIVGAGVSLSPNSDGFLGGVLYVAMYALPLALFGFGLRSAKHGWRTATGWAALVLAAGYSAVVIGNWSGYAPLQALFVLVVTAPTVAVDLVIFWATVLHRPARPAPSATSASTG